jgi:adenine C2-methylase RlmN of 23S rRNA A2503 and tRNA A37
MHLRLADIAAQCRAAYEAAQAFCGSLQYSNVANIVIAGMGGAV